MKTAKEKAKELIDKFVNQPINFPYIDSEDGRCIGAGYMTYKSAKQCALIAIDEILQTNPTIKGTSDDLLTQIVQTKAYWYRVQDAINEL